MLEIDGHNAVLEEIIIKDLMVIDTLGIGMILLRLFLGLVMCVPIVGLCKYVQKYLPVVLQIAFPFAEIRFQRI